MGIVEYREILRLKACGFSERKTAESVSRSRNTVSAVLERAAAAGMKWPLPPDLTDADIEKRLFPEKSKNNSARTPDFEYIHSELAKEGVTLTLLWDEYCESCGAKKETPYQYSQFCRMYKKFAVTTKATMHIRRKPGDTMEVDWAGQTAFISDSVTGKQIPAYIFVATLPVSQYAYVEAFPRRAVVNWIDAHIHAFAYFGGVPRMVVPDNLKTGVVKPDWYSPELNRTYLEMAEYYGTAIMPARVKHPKDKASVEGTVGDISTWITAALRNQTYFSFTELNADISRQLAVFNEKPFQKRTGSRKSVFIEEERDMLYPLPATPYEIARWKEATVAYNYHVYVDGKYYSVPYEYLKQKVDIRVTPKTVEVFFNRSRICSHPNIHESKALYKTESGHMPPQHRKYGEWDAGRFVSWGESIGKNTAEVIRSVFSRCKAEQQGYRTCMGILKMGEKYSAETFEAACAKALSYTPYPTYKNLQAILQSGIEKEKSKEDTPPKKPAPTGRSFIRGAEYYGGENNVEQ